MRRLQEGVLEKEREQPILFAKPGDDESLALFSAANDCQPGDWQGAQSLACHGIRGSTHVLAQGLAVLPWHLAHPGLSFVLLALLPLSLFFRFVVVVT